MRRHSRSGFIVMLTVCAVMTVSAAAEGDAIDEWLILGPVPTPLPAFDDDKPGGYGFVDLLEARAFPGEVLRPRADATESWFGDTSLVWERRRTGSGGKLALTLPDGASGDASHTVWLASFLEAGRFQTLRLELAGSHVRGAWIDGEQVAASEGGADLGEPLEGQLELAPGKHILLVKTIFDPSGEADWWVSASLAPQSEDQEIQGLHISSAPDRPRGSSSLHLSHRTRA